MPYGPCHKYSVLPVSCGSSRRQYINKWVWPCSHKTLLTTTLRVQVWPVHYGFHLQFEGGKKVFWFVLFSLSLCGYQSRRVAIVIIQWSPTWDNQISDVLSFLSIFQFDRNNPFIPHAWTNRKVSCFSLEGFEAFPIKIFFQFLFLVNYYWPL